MCILRSSRVGKHVRALVCCVPLSFAQTAPGPFGLVLALLLSVLAAPGPFGLALALLLSVLFFLEGGKQLHSDTAQAAHDPSRPEAEVAGLKFGGR